MIKAPNVFSGKPIALWPLPPLDLEGANSVALLDALCVASQVQMAGPNSEIRQAWRQRQNEIHAELRKRLAPAAV